MFKNLFFTYYILIWMCTSAYGQCPSICRPTKPGPMVCVINDRQDLCARMPQCEVDEMNCRLRAINRRSLTLTDISNCRNNKFILFAEPCANKPTRVQRATRTNCKHMRCLDPRPTLGCYSSRDRRCRLLTYCQVQRLNCESTSGNQLTRDDPRLCSGMTAGQALRECYRPTNRH